MGKFYVIFAIVAALQCNSKVVAQADSTETLIKLTTSYVSAIDKKIDKYNSRINRRTEKALKKLAKWEGKIELLIQKANPELSRRLFSNRKLTFSYMLEKFRNGEKIIQKYQLEYDHYIDKLNVNLKYIDSQKIKLDSNTYRSALKVRSKLDSLLKQNTSLDELQQLIKDRKKQLLSAAFKSLGNNKYLRRINKEAWYYTETIRNYKSIFNDPSKTEKAVKDILHQIPGFKNFVARNSHLASIFGVPAGSGIQSNGQSIMGLQSTSSVQNAIRTSFGGNTNIRQLVQQNVQQAQNELSRLKNELIKKGGSGNELAMPDFKPNMQKTKTFWQRVEYEFNVQFAKNNSFVPTTADLAIGAGYKLNDKSLIGLGLSYRLGMGSIENIRLSHQGVGLRSYIDWKLKRQIFISGGFEMNYNSAFKNFGTLKNANDWQRSALLGLSKKIGLRTKYFKATKFQLLYDFLARQHIPVSQPVLFRVGYSF